MGKVYNLYWQEWICFCATFEQSAMNVGRRKLFSGPFQPPAVFEGLGSANVKTHEDHIGATVGKPVLASLESGNLALSVNCHLRSL